MVLLGLGVKAVKTVAKSKVAKKAVGAIGKAIGLKGATKHRRSSLNINKLTKKLIKAKIEGKIMKAKLSGIKGF